MHNFYKSGTFEKKDPFLQACLCFLCKSAIKSFVCRGICLPECFAATKKLPGKPGEFDF